MSLSDERYHPDSGLIPCYSEKDVREAVKKLISNFPLDNSFCLETPHDQILEIIKQIFGEKLV